MFEPNVYNQGNNNYHLGADEPSDNAFRRIRTAHSVSISPELFEKMYLNPQKEVKGDLRKTFGNPTPLQVPLLVFSCFAPKLIIKQSTHRLPSDRDPDIDGDDGMEGCC